MRGGACQPQRRSSHCRLLQQHAVRRAARAAVRRAAAQRELCHRNVPRSTALRATDDDDAADNNNNKTSKSILPGLHAILLHAQATDEHVRNGAEAESRR